MTDGVTAMARAAPLNAIDNARTRTDFLNIVISYFFEPFIRLAYLWYLLITAVTANYFFLAPRAKGIAILFE
jgi:hypothetical protein